MTTLDLEGAPDVRSFYGRHEAVGTLSAFLVDGESSLVVIHGMGGAGKTWLALGAVLQPSNKGGLTSELRADIAKRFRHVVWRSLLNSPSLPDLLRQLIASIPEAEEPPAPRAADGEVSVERLVAKLKAQPVLMILDNAESLLDTNGGSNLREYRAEYAELFRAITAAGGESCLVLTTREVTPVLDGLCGPERAGIVYRMPRLESDGCRKILGKYGIECPDRAMAGVLEAYGDSPLLLELAAKRAVLVQDASVDIMLEKGPGEHDRFSSILKWHLARLTARERAVATCLAIAREPLTLSELERDLLADRSEGVDEALASIGNKILVERRGRAFTLHPVLIEHLTDDVVELVVGEIDSGKLNVLDKHALLKATATDPVRLAQQLLILKRILARLDAGRTSELSVKERLLGVIERLRGQGSTGFGVGNVLNLLCALGDPIKELDLGRLTIRNAFLRDTNLIRCNFTDATMSGCVYAASVGIVLSVAVSPDGAEIVSGDNKGKVQAWRLSDGYEVRNYPGHVDWVRSIAFSRDGTMMATTGSDYDVRVWDRASGRCNHVLRGHTEQAYSVDFSPDGRFLASGAEDRRVILWDPATGDRVGGFEVMSGRVRSVRFSPTGDLLVVAAGRVSTWRVPDFKPVSESDPMGDHARRAVFSPDGTRIAAIDSRQRVHVLDAGTLQTILNPVGSEGANWLEFSPDGLQLAAGCQDGAVRRWMVADRFERLPALPAHDAPIRSIAFASPDLIVTGGEDRFIKLLDVRAGGVVRTIRGAANGIRGVAWGAVTDEVAVACEDGRVEVWHHADGVLARARTFWGHAGAVEAVAFDPREGSVASAADDGTIRIWDRSTGQATVFEAHASWVWCLAFDAVGGRLVTGGKDRRVTLWDVATRRMVRDFHGHGDEVHAALFMGTDTLVSGGDDSMIRFWDIRTGELKASIPAHDNCVRSLAYVQTADVLASGSDDGTVKLWNVSGEHLRTLKGHSARVRSVVFDAQARRLFSAGDDATVRVWDVAEGCCVEQLHGHSLGIWSISTNPGGTMLAAGGMDGSIRIWNLADGTSARYWPERPYEGSRIPNIRGLLPTELATWVAFGAQPADDGQTSTAVAGLHARDETGSSTPAAASTNDNVGTLSEPNTVVSVDDLWDATREILVELYPHGPDQNAIWERAGGDMSRIQKGRTGRDAWHFALDLLRKGGGGTIDLPSLLATVSQEYGKNQRLPQILERVAALRLG